MKIYELIRARNAEERNIRNSYDREIISILKKWFPEYEIDYTCNDVMFRCCNDYWCRFSLYEGNVYSFEYLDDSGKKVINKESIYRLSKNNGLSKEEIKSIKQRLDKLYEGAYES